MFSQLLVFATQTYATCLRYASGIGYRATIKLFRQLNKQPQTSRTRLIDRLYMLGFVGSIGLSQRIRPFLP